MYFKFLGSQKNLSSQILLILFSCYSGEKTSAKEWPGFLEIKGRVRLDAFEKFLQELPLSRSRAVMVSQVTFYCSTKYVSFYILQSMKNGRSFIATSDVHYLLNTSDTLVGLLLMEEGFSVSTEHSSDFCGGKYITKQNKLVFLVKQNS